MERAVGFQGDRKLVTPGDQTKAQWAGMERAVGFQGDRKGRPYLDIVTLCTLSSYI